MYVLYIYCPSMIGNLTRYEDMRQTLPGSFYPLNVILTFPFRSQGLLTCAIK